MSTRSYKIKRIHAVERAVAVMDCLHAHPEGMALRELHQRLAIAKPTLLRILATLRDQGMVWQRLADHAWLGSDRRQRIVSLQQPFWLAELASPILAELALKVPWPSQVSIPIEGAMQVIESNYSEAFIDPLPPNSIGYRVPVLRSASGRAWFGYASPAARDSMLAHLRQSPLEGNQEAREPAAVEALIAEVTQRGYATRSPLFGGDFNIPRTISDDARETIALPIRLDGCSIASLNLTWKNHVVDLKKVIAMHFEVFKAAALGIENAARDYVAQRSLFKD